MAKIPFVVSPVNISTSVLALLSASPNWGHSDYRGTLNNPHYPFKMKPSPLCTLFFIVPVRFCFFFSFYLDKICIVSLNRCRWTRVGLFKIPALSSSSYPLCIQTFAYVQPLPWCWWMCCNVHFSFHVGVKFCWHMLTFLTHSFLCRYEFGSAIFIAWAGAFLAVVGGAMLAASCPRGKPSPKYPISRPPSSKEYVWTGWDCWRLKEHFDIHACPSQRLKRWKDVS